MILFLGNQLTTALGTMGIGGGLGKFFVCFIFPITTEFRGYVSFGGAGGAACVLFTDAN